MDEDYRVYKEYQEYEEQIGNIVRASTSCLRLPSKISWDNLKLSLQSMYKNVIPQIHLFQFLIQKQDFLKMDTQGMSILSDFLTQNLVDAMWGMLGRIHPLSK